MGHPAVGGYEIGKSRALPGGQPRAAVPTLGLSEGWL
jgi:hypothetical protein